MTDERLKPFSTGGFLLVQLAMFVPVLNLILLLVFALSGGTNISLQNWSRAMLILVGIGLLLSLIGAILGITVFGAVVHAIREAMVNMEMPGEIPVPK